MIDSRITRLHTYGTVCTYRYHAKIRTNLHYNYNVYNLIDFNTVLRIRIRDGKIQIRDKNPKPQDCYNPVGTVLVPAFRQNEFNIFWCTQIWHVEYNVTPNRDPGAQKTWIQVSRLYGSCIVPFCPWNRPLPVPYRTFFAKAMLLIFCFTTEILNSSPEYSILAEVPYRTDLQGKT
jgi:hypothetical protein